MAFVYIQHWYWHLGMFWSTQINFYSCTSQRHRRLLLINQPPCPSKSNGFTPFHLAVVLLDSIAGNNRDHGVIAVINMRPHGLSSKHFLVIHALYIHWLTPLRLLELTTLVFLMHSQSFHGSEDLFKLDTMIGNPMSPFFSRKSQNLFST
jgi:hypothetical protein